MAYQPTAPQEGEMNMLSLIIDLILNLTAGGKPSNPVTVSIQ